jgi:hypothetical protein
VLLFVAGGSISMLLSGCATPPAIKTASKTQCELIGELDQSVQALENGLMQFHQDNQAQIRQVGRVLIAQQAIKVVMENGGIPKTTNGTTEVDVLFTNSNERIRPFVDYAFSGDEISNSIKQLTNSMNAETNRVVSAMLHSKLRGLEVLQASLQKKPEQVAALEDVIEGELATQAETEKEIKLLLDVVRSQVGLMKVMATTVDAWLALDVTISKAQTENLENAVLDAHKALGGGN